MKSGKRALAPVGERRGRKGPARQPGTSHRELDQEKAKKRGRGGRGSARAELGNLRRSGRGWSEPQIGKGPGESAARTVKREKEGARRVLPANRKPG